MVNVFLNLLLFIFKFIGGKISKSVSVTADAFNNLCDAGITLATYFGLKIASIGAGEYHPNGHGRFEWVIALLSSAGVLVIGLELGKDSINSIQNPELFVFSTFTIMVLIVSISIKMFMYFYNVKKEKENEVSSYKAIAIDSLSDAISTSAVLASLILYKATGINIDGYCGIVVALFIIYSSLQSFFDTADRIMGRSPSKEELDKMKNFVMKNHDFQEVFDLQIEDYGFGRHRVSMIVLGKSEIDGDKLIDDVAEVTASIYKEFGYNVMIALEKPSKDKNEEIIFNNIKEIINSQSIPTKLLSMRLCDGLNKKVIHLEIGVPHDYFKKLDEVNNQISKQVRNLNSDIVVIPKVRLMRGNKMRRQK